MLNKTQNKIGIIVFGTGKTSHGTCSTILNYVEVTLNYLVK